MDSPLVEAVGLERRFGGGHTAVAAVRGVDLSIQRGEVHVVTGPSGSGKSSLLYLIGALDRPSAGAVRFEGRDLAALGESARALLRRSGIGFVFQSHRLLPVLTALENALVPAIPGGVSRAVRERAVALLEGVGLGSRLHHKPSQLSGGEQQRVAVVRALVMEPRLVLADEPTGELDRATGRQVVSLLRQLAGERGTAMMLITHDLSLLGPGDWHHPMCDGRVVASARWTDAAPASDGAGPAR